MLDKNLFMICRRLNHEATRELPQGFHLRLCREDELDIWKAMPFDTTDLTPEQDAFMTAFFNEVYLPKGDLFFECCMFVCDSDDRPIGTCFLWKAYDSVWTLHWFKVLEAYEGQGIGRALLSLVMKSLAEEEYPIFLHTQPESAQAIKPYSDVGFEFISDPVIGQRTNDLAACWPELRRSMPHEDFANLQVTRAPQFFLDAVSDSEIHEF